MSKNFNFKIMHCMYMYRWVEGDTLLVPNNSYTNWFGGSAAVTNQGPYDCVKFTSEGWKVHDYFCDSSIFPFLCRQEGK